MTPDDDATPERGRRADRGRRSAGPPARTRRLPQVPRITLSAVPRRASPDADATEVIRRPSERDVARDAARDRRDEDLPGPDWLPRWIRRVDRRVLVTTAVGMLVAALVGGAVAAFGLGLIFVTDACDVDSYVCDDTLFTLGYALAVAGPLLLTGVALLVALVGMIRGRTRPWLVLLIGVAASLAAYVLGAVLVLVAVPGSSPIT
ncbi:hypothetical protein FGG90_13365 [Clavibacter tessellarius]|uniref:Uncharacterized protein n=1 Tax=Clavibacter tessellarius TaxID=31965 RepID=A0A225C6C5_9MICO|nr:hypothetical protein [Clavibacter michiganensis]OQJ62119.1 hypothetical protein B5P24_03350 [Clavibacter michiganensis subsp. tessellarius]UKF34881.1 hypothetical protein FGG90_13365 [Clavibacter michiganensis subsp. tessellarius]